ncbi:PaaI family thioesterase [Maricaulis sp.]|uniref:PaaI family thioesterase n=1 Tax=unclassified Maricaulis TaxID=2632371 RepID=UPI001B199B41|nr:PaaI family thioesterase [Maricaulis sp.]MBO6796733.1 PaaI family thioesterase [Maricaulis sp.]
MRMQKPVPADLAAGKEIVPLADDEILQRLNSIGEHEHAAGLLGFHPRDFSVDEQWLEANFNPDPRCANLRGGVQGGMICAMLDEVMSLSVVVAERFTIGVPTLELKTSFMAPLPLGSCKARGQALRIGRNVAFMEGIVWTAEGEIAARASATCQVRRSSRIRKT